MRSSSSSVFRGTVLVASACAALSLAGCDEGVGPLVDLPPANPGFEWIVCSVVGFSATTGQALGGVDAVITHRSGHTLAVPAEALPAGTRVSFRLEEPRSRHVQLEVTAPGLPDLTQPLALTLDFGRSCRSADGSALDPQTLTVFRVDFDGGLHDPLPTAALVQSKITVTLDALSTFAIGGAT